MSGGDHPHVQGLHLVGAQRLHLLLLQHPQQLGLQRQIADLVEEQRAAVGQLELAGPRAVGPGEAPGAVPNSSASTSDSGMAATFTATKGPLERSDRLWMPWASSSLPVPVSPRSSTVASSWAARRAWRFTSLAAALVPMKPAMV